MCASCYQHGEKKEFEVFHKLPTKKNKNIGGIALPQKTKTNVAKNPHDSEKIK